MPQFPHIAFDSVSKRFGPVVANDGITCEVAAGGIHAFLGENGAGKSTLMKILSGVYQPDSGSILLNGVPLRLRSPSDARKQGIGMVYQHLSLVPSMTVLDNILLGDKRVPLLLNRKVLSGKVAEKAAKFGFSFDLDASVSAITVADRQRLEIFKLLWQEASVLILDEPTSQLAPFEADEILTAIRGLAQDGRTVLWISHNIGEVIRFASRITILARGKCVKTCSPESARIHELARLMIGDLKFSASPKFNRVQGKPLIGVRDVQIAPSANGRRVSDLSFDIYPGEVLGVAGVAHSGQEELAALLTGHLHPNGGTLFVNGIMQPWDMLRRRNSCASYVPADVKHDASVPTLNLAHNLFLRDIFSDDAVVGPFLRRSLMHEHARQRIASFEIRPSNSQLDCGALSGGNLQRLVLAREFGHTSPVLVAVNPTAGLDVAASNLVRARLRLHAQSGKAILLISNDLEELLEVADRLMVLFDGTPVGLESTDTLSAESIGLLMGGAKTDVVHALCGPSSANGRADDIRAALHLLLQSDSSVQRGLAAQLGWRHFVASDAPRIQQHLAGENYQEVRIWFRIILAKLVEGPELDALIRAFFIEPSGFVEAYRKIRNAPDYGTLKELLLSKSGHELAAWERILSGLTLRHLGEDVRVELPLGFVSADTASLLISCNGKGAHRV